MGERFRLVGVLTAVLFVGILVGSGLGQWLPDTRPAPANAAPRSGPPDRIRVEVLNAGGRAGMARKAREVLLSHGVDVVYFGNDTRFGRDSSEVVLRHGRAGNADYVAGILGIASVRQALDSALYLDVTIRLGADWDPDGVTTPPEDPGSDLRAVTPGR